MKNDVFIENEPFLLLSLLGKYLRNLAETTAALKFRGVA